MNTNDWKSVSNQILPKIYILINPALNSVLDLDNAEECKPF